MDGAPERKTAESNYADGADEGVASFAWRLVSLFFECALVDGRR